MIPLFNSKKIGVWSTIAIVGESQNVPTLNVTPSGRPPQNDAAKAMPRYKSASQWLWATLALLGLILFSTGAWKAQRMWVCGKWPATRGTVVESELKRGHMREGSHKYRYHLMYTYTVQDQTYRNHRIAFDGTAPGDIQPRFLPQRYPVGHTVSVHYHPRHPELAVLETHMSLKGFKPLIIGMVMTFLGVGGLFWRWPLQTDYLFRERDPDEPLTKSQIALGSLGMLCCLGIFWIWWELIKMYAGR